MTKNQEMGLHFYMQGCDKNGTATGQKIDLEEHFAGLTYSSCDGLLKKGKIKNAYIENYSDSDKLRVHFPENPTREATKVTFNFVVVGDNRQAVYDAFYDYITGGYRIYSDNARNKKLYFIATSGYEPSKEQWYGSTPYLELKVEVQNIYGTTFDVEQ